MTLLYCDGSGWNGRFCRTAVCSDDLKYVDVRRHPRATSNVMEYTAAILALEYAKEHGLHDGHLYSDSFLVVNQVTGEWAVRDLKLVPLAARVRELLQETGYALVHVPRHQNKAGRILEK